MLTRFQLLCNSPASWLQEKLIYGLLSKLSGSIPRERECCANFSAFSSVVQYRFPCSSYHRIKGNIKDQSLTQACIKEALERRCDRAFQQVKTEEEYEVSLLLSI